MNLKTTDVNKLIEVMGVKALSSGQKEKKPISDEQEDKKNITNSEK